MIIWRLRAIILLLSVLLTGFTAIGMAMMPVAMPTAMVGDDASHMHHDGGSRQDGGQHDGGADCLYCHLAKATDLPTTVKPATVYRRLLPRFAAVELASCHVPAWVTPCQPRAPPRAVAA